MSSNTKVLAKNNIQTTLSSSLSTCFAAVAVAIHYFIITVHTTTLMQ